MAWRALRGDDEQATWGRELVSVRRRQHGVGLLLQIFDDGRVAQRGRVAQLVALGDVLQQPPHDLARTRLGQVVDDDHGLGPGDLADLLADPLAQLCRQLVARLVAAAQQHEAERRLAGQRVGRRGRCGLGHRRVLDQRRLQLDRREPVPGDVHHVVDAAQQPEVAVGVLARAVAGEVDALGRTARSSWRRSARRPRTACGTCPATAG